jgi:hypothetical protein
MIINSNPGSGNTFCSVLLEESLGYWVETKHQPHILNEKINQITLFRNPYDSVLSSLERHFQNLHPDLKPFDLNNQDEVKNNVKQYVRLYNIYLDDYQKNYIYPVTYEHLRNNPIIFVKSIANFFDLKIINEDINEDKIVKKIINTQNFFEHRKKRLTPVKEKESLIKILKSDNSLKELYERYCQHKEILQNVHNN